jgi:N-acetylmuramoyl-L-alanine amidase
MNLKQLVIHCTDTPAGREVTADDIRRWHTTPPPGGRGWSRVGYSDMIHLDGKVENLVRYDEDEQVEPNEVTNGAAGYNASSRHVVYSGGMSATGGKPEDTRTDEQKQALADYVTAFLKEHPTCKVVGHNQLAAKACPSFNVSEWLREIGVDEANIL